MSYSPPQKPETWTRDPRRIDPRHFGFWRGLRFCAPFCESGLSDRQKPVELLTEEIATQASAYTGVYRASRLGRAMVGAGNAGTDNSFQFKANDFRHIMPALTCECVCRRVAGAEEQETSYLVSSHDAGAANATFYMLIGGKAGGYAHTFAVYFQSGSSQLFNTIASPPGAEEWHSFHAIYNPRDTASQSIRCFFNGAKLYTRNQGDSGGVGKGTAQKIWIGGTAFNNWLGLEATEVSIVSFWGRAFTDREIRLRAEDPWGFIRPVDKVDGLRYFFLPAGAAPPVQKTATDTGAGSEVIATPEVEIVVADAGAGADDNLAPGVIVAVTDSGAGSDVESVPALGVDLADAGAAADVATIPERVAGIDETAAGSDDVSIPAIVIVVSGTGTGSDVASLVGMGDLKTASDAAAGTDVASAPAVSFDVADAGAGADAVALSAELVATDVGTAAEALALALVLEVPDTGTAGDVSAIQTGDFKTVLESIAGVDDALTVERVSVVGDTGAGADAPGVSLAVSVADLATAADVVALAQAIVKQATDTGQGADVPLVASVSIRVAETATMVDVLALARSLELSDTITGVDVVRLPGFEEDTAREMRVRFAIGREVILRFGFNPPQE